MPLLLPVVVVLVALVVFVAVAALKFAFLTVFEVCFCRLCQEILSSPPTSSLFLRGSQSRLCRSRRAELTGVAQRLRPSPSLRLRLRLSLNHRRKTEPQKMSIKLIIVSEFICFCLQCKTVACHQQRSLPLDTASGNTSRGPVSFSQFFLVLFGQKAKVCQAFDTRVILCLINRQTALTCGLPELSWFH